MPNSAARDQDVTGDPSRIRTFNPRSRNVFDHFRVSHWLLWEMFNQMGAVRAFFQGFHSGFSAVFSHSLSNACTHTAHLFCETPRQSSGDASVDPIQRNLRPVAELQRLVDADPSQSSFVIIPCLRSDADKPTPVGLAVSQCLASPLQPGADGFSCHRGPDLLHVPYLAGAIHPRSTGILMKPNAQSFQSQPQDRSNCAASLNDVFKAFADHNDELTIGADCRNCYVLVSRVVEEIQFVKGYSDRAKAACDTPRKKRDLRPCLGQRSGYVAQVKGLTRQSFGA